MDFLLPVFSNDAFTRGHSFHLRLCLLLAKKEGVLKHNFIVEQIETVTLKEKYSSAYLLFDGFLPYRRRASAGDIAALYRELRAWDVASARTMQKYGF